MDALAKRLSAMSILTVEARDSSSVPTHQLGDTKQVPILETGYGSTTGISKTGDIAVGDIKRRRLRADASLDTASSSHKVERTASTECLATSALCYSASPFGENDDCEGGKGRGEEGGERPQNNTGSGYADSSFSLKDGEEQQPGAIPTAEDATSPSPVDQTFQSPESKEEQVIKERLKVLVLLHHVYTCQADGACTVSDCGGLKRMWGHARACDGHACKEAVSWNDVPAAFIRCMPDCPPQLFPLERS